MAAPGSPDRFPRPGLIASHNDERIRDVPVAANTRSNHTLPGPVRRLGLLPLSFFLIHAYYYYSHGGLIQMLWMCNLGNLVLAAGLLLGFPEVIRVGVFWLIPGLPLWIWFIVMKGGWLLTSGVSHFGGLSVGLIGLRRVRANTRTWFYAFLWFMLARQICAVVTQPEPNVNLAHRVFPGWESQFGEFWKFWMATTILAAAGCWILGKILLMIFPMPEEILDERAISFLETQAPNAGEGGGFHQSRPGHTRE